MKDNSDKEMQKLVNINKKNIEDLLKSVMQDYVSRQRNVKIEKTKNVESLVSYISEYLSAFIIMGYDVNGDPVNILHAKNQMDADALTAALNRFIFNTASNNNQ